MNFGLKGSVMLLKEAGRCEGARVRRPDSRQVDFSFFCKINLQKSPMKEAGRCEGARTQCPDNATDDTRHDDFQKRRMMIFRRSKTAHGDFQQIKRGAYDDFS
jgi:hypothetical protein